MTELYEKIKELKHLFQEQIGRVGKIDLSFRGRIILLSENERRRIRKKMLETPFRGKTLDFLRWISTHVIAKELKEIYRHTPIEVIPALKTLAYRCDTQNTLHLFRRFPDYFLDAIEMTSPENREELTARINDLCDATILEEEKALGRCRTTKAEYQTLTMIPHKEICDALTEFAEKHGFKVDRIEKVLLRGQFSKLEIIEGAAQ